MKDINYTAEMCLDDIQGLFHIVDNHDYDKEFETIRNDLKVLNLLKEKKVDLENIRCGLNHYVKRLKIEEKDAFIEIFNNYNATHQTRQLTQEEMTAIVEWLKEGK